MAHYFFDVRDNGVLDRDEEGMELPDLASAVHAAREAFGDRLSGPAGAGQEPAVRIEIRNDADPLPVFVLDAESAALPS
jgi:hypothetical protein